MRGHSNVTICKRKINSSFALYDRMHLVQPEGGNRKLSDERSCAHRIRKNIRRDCSKDQRN